MGQIIDTNADLSAMTDEQLLEAAGVIVGMQEKDLKEYSLRYYRPANKEIARIHNLTNGVIGIFGGNGSGKTEHALVEGIIRATGCVPESLKGIYPMQKLRGPIHMRVVCESITAILEPIILPKLQWWSWSGLKPQGGTQGHWGWIPRHCLIEGDWKKSFNSRTRMLSVRYINPETGKFEGYSTIQFMSYDQDPENFASGDVDYCLHDEPPPHAIWRENRARTMRAGSGSTMLVSMTWPDNPASPVDWIFDEIFDKGTPGKLKEEDVEVINIYSTLNPHLDQDKVALAASQMTKVERLTRIFGQPIRFSNRIHPDFTDQDKYWCYECGKITIATTDDRCSECDSHEIGTYNNVEICEPNSFYPCVCLLDPHPRKPHMLTWVQVTPNEDFEVVATLQVEGGTEAVRDEVREIEERLQFKYITRIMDPNMGSQPSGAVREITWQMEFDRVGLHFDLGDDSSVGRSRLNDFIKPDRSFRRTRFRVDPSCADAIFQMCRYVWADHKNAENKDISQEPMKKNDDFPTLFKYLFNYMPSGTPTPPTVHKRNRTSSDYKIQQPKVSHYGRR